MSTPAVPSALPPPRHRTRTAAVTTAFAALTLSLLPGLIPTPATALPTPRASATTATSPPARPSLASVTRSPSGGYRLTWNPVPEAEGYSVHVQVPQGTTRDGKYTITSWKWVRLASLGPVTSYTTPDNLWPHTIGYRSQPFALTAHADGISSSRSAARSAACAGGYFIAARGSGNNPNSPGANNYGEGMGAYGLRIYEDVRARLGEQRSTFQPVAVNYPADDVSWDSSTDYYASKNAGRDRTRAIVEAISRACPSAEVVLFGFSQGAHVVGDAFQMLAPDTKARVVRMVLFSDPARNENDRSVTFAPSNPRSGGVLADRPQFTATTDRAQVESWCWKRDLVCTAGTRAHGSAYDCYALWVARSIALRARSQRWDSSADTTAPTCRPEP